MDGGALKVIILVVLAGLCRDVVGRASQPTPTGLTAVIKIDECGRTLEDPY